jgi:hypothetical protein
MRPAEVVVTSCRPTLTSEWLNPMPRRERASSRKSRPRSRSERKPRPQAINEPRANEPSVLQAAVFKPVALSAPDYSLSSPDFADPRVKEIPELIAIMLEEIWRRVGGAPNLPIKVIASWFAGRTLSDGSVITPRLARQMAAICQSVFLRAGGNRWQKLNPSTVKPLNG